MCIAIFIPQGNAVSMERLHNGWLSNDDGAGYCFIDEAGEIVIKRFMTWIPFWDMYEKDFKNYGDTSPFLVHFRITSRGATNIENCHPFRVNDDMAIIHNGTITNIDIPKEDKRSDTRIFAEEWLPSIGEQLLDNVYMFELAKGFIGSSKVCIMHRTRGVFILNEGLGTWDTTDGCWYSNKSYLSAPYKPMVVDKHDPWGYHPSKVTTADSYTRSYYSKPVIVNNCDWCYAQEASYIVMGGHKELELCDACMLEYKELYGEILCSVCELSIDTKGYITTEFPIENYVLCDECKDSSFWEGELTEIELYNFK